MKQTFTTRLLILGFGCVIAIQGMSSLHPTIQRVIESDMTKSPQFYIMIFLGLVMMGVALGSEDSEK